MNNYIYVLSDKENIKVEKLHICTWDVKEKNALIELGMSFPSDNLPDKFDIYVFAPFLLKNCEAKSLHDTLKEPENFKFIFNEKRIGSDDIGENARDGSVVHYQKGNDEAKMAIVNVVPNKENGYFKMTIHKPHIIFDSLYCRILIETSEKCLAEVTKGITKKNYKYDFKINESRNIPADVLNYRDNNHLHEMGVVSSYCLHCVPADFEMAYSDSRKLQSVRILETDAFNHYLPSLAIKGEYIITFQKDTKAGSFSFFTSFTREHIGNKQLFLAIGANIICSFLFAEAEWRFTDKTDGEWYDKIPVEWWIALVVVLGCFVWCFSLWSWGWNKIKQFGSWVKRKCTPK